MAFWSRLRALLTGTRDSTSEPAADAAAAESPEPEPASPASARTPPTDGVASPLPGLIDDWNARTSTGVITLLDGATVGFGQEACEGFVPLIGLKVCVLSVGVPPRDEADEAPGLWATALILRPGSEAEYAARLRISQVERALGKGDAPVGGAALPPWARVKVGVKPAGPQRPHDAFFVLTVVLDGELPAEPRRLAELFTSEVLPRPSVRVIPLVRKGRAEPGFSAEISGDERRAFLLYRPEPYAGASGSPQGHGHVGLFVGGPNSPRTLKKRGQLSGPPPLGPDGEVRLLSDLARSLLSHQSAAPGLVVNRAGKVFKPRETALSQLGDGEGQRTPFLFWIDWNLGEHGGRRCQLSIGMESLGLPDVAVVTSDERSCDRSRDVLWHACRVLAEGDLSDDAATLQVPRRLRLLPGSLLQTEDPDDHEPYRILSRDDDWLVLERAPEIPPA